MVKGRWLRQKVFVTQKPEELSLGSLSWKRKSWVWCYMPEIPVVGRERQADSWWFTASRPS